MKTKSACGAMVLILLMAGSQTARAGFHRWHGGCGYSWGCGGAVSACAGCWADGCVASPQCTVQQTVLVPEYTTETRLVNVTEWTTQPRQRQVTVLRQVAQTRTVEQRVVVAKLEERRRVVDCVVQKPVYETRTEKYTVMVPHLETRQQKCTVQVPEWKTRQQQYAVQVPQWKEVEQTVMVAVPQQEVRQGTRRVVRCVPVTTRRQVTVDCGHWATQWVEFPCGGCDPCGGCASPCVPATHMVCRKVWVPQLQTREVDVTTVQQQVSDEPYSYTVTVCKLEPRKQTVRVCQMRTETRTREVPYCTLRTEERSRTVQVCVPRAEERTRSYQVCRLQSETQRKEVVEMVCVPTPVTRQVQVTSYRCVPETHTETYQACVPRTVQKEIQVRVCRMVPKTVTVTVDACGSCYDCGGCY